MSARTNLNGYEALGNAVVVQATTDYRDAVAKIKKYEEKHGRKTGKRCIAAEDVKAECERFFKSSHFNCFTTLDGEMILSMLEKEACV